MLKMAVIYTGIRATEKLQYLESLGLEASFFYSSFEYKEVQEIHNKGIIETSILSIG